MMGYALFLSAVSTAAFAIPQPKYMHSSGSSATAPDLKDVGIIERLGSQVEIEKYHFKDESGKDVLLSQYFTSKRPVILSLVYFGCPNLCGLVLNGMTDGMRELNWNVGKEFDVVTISIDPKEDAALATEKKKSQLAMYRRMGAENGWHFLTGTEDQIRKLAAQVGFGYHYDEKAKEYAHAAGIFVLTPSGVISRVLYGIEYSARDLKLALLEASDGKVGTITDRILLYCYKYDALAKGYSFYAMRLVQAGAAVTLIALFGYLFWFWRRERQFARAQAQLIKEGMQKP